MHLIVIFVGDVCCISRDTSHAKVFMCVSYAEARNRYRLDVRPSVRPSVCHTLALYQNG